MNSTSYLAILAGSVLAAAGIAGCDAGDQRDPGTPEPESSAMYGADDTGYGETTDTLTDRQTDAMRDRQMEAEDRVQQAQRQAQEERDRMAAGQTDTTLDSLDTIGTDELIGKTVVSQQGEEIGEIDDVVMDQSSQEHMAIVDVGGFLGIGEKSVAVAFDQLQLSEDGRVLSNLTRETLEAQPEYDPAQYGEMPDPEPM